MQYRILYARLHEQQLKCGEVYDGDHIRKCGYDPDALVKVGEAEPVSPAPTTASAAPAKKKGK